MKLVEAVVVEVEGMHSMVRVLYCTGSTFSGGRNRKREEPSST